AGNYSLTSVGTTTANITPLGITGSFTADNKVYDGNNSATVLTRSLSGVLAGDLLNVSLSGGTATFANANVANGKRVTLAGATLTGSAAVNYSVTSVSTTTADIAKRALAITAMTNTKMYDGNTSAAATPTVSGLQGTDTVSGLADIYGNPNVATGKTLTVSSYTIND